MRTIRVGNFVYPRTKYVECVLSGECLGSPELLPRAEILDVEKWLEDIGITAVYRTSNGILYVYEKELPFYFTDGRGPSEKSVSVIESFIDEGFTRVHGADAPLHMKYVLINFDPHFYVEIKNNEYSLVGAVRHGREIRAYSYKRVIDEYTGNIMSQELKFWPPDGDVEVKVLGEFVSMWDEFLNSIKRMKEYTNRGIIMRTFDLPGVVNTSRYPPYQNYEEIEEVVEGARVVSYDSMGPTLATESFVCKFVLPVQKVVSYYPIRHSFVGFDMPSYFILNGVDEEKIVASSLL